MIQHGLLCEKWCGVKLPLQVLQSGAGFYIGCFSNAEGPMSRESDCYWRTREEAEEAFNSGHWPQKPHP